MKSIKSIRGANPEINAIHFDSRLVRKDDLFIAIKGESVDGHKFIEKAIENGAKAIIHADDLGNYHDEVSYIQVENPRKALALVAKRFYKDPSSELFLVAITGTNGKTTIASSLYNLYEAAGFRVGLISTICYKWIDKSIDASHTTPDPKKLNEILMEMISDGVTHVFMEASSHALDQDRMDGLDIDMAVFTNLSRDHMDYHKSTSAYIQAKKRLFDGLKKSAIAIINLDDKNGSVMIQNCQARVKTIALRRPADYKAKILTLDSHGASVEIDQKQIQLQMLGEFNVYNLLTVYAVACENDWSEDEALLGLSTLKPPKGRMEFVSNHIGILPIIDYAHTPDALSKILETIRDLATSNQRIITVVGCGGDRDKGKRPQMAEIASQQSDVAIFTSDNPRSEDPESIIDEMLMGRIENNWLRIVDRQAAIKKALHIAQVGDLILIAGKGHEEYQVLKNQTIPFSDRKEVERYLKEL